MGISKICGIIFVKKILWNWSMDLHRVHDTPVHQSIKDIKCWPFKMRYAAQISYDEPFSELLIGALCCSVDDGD
jgi:hypothetical protein